MVSDSLKITRVLELYNLFQTGKIVNKQEMADIYHVNARTIQRDIDNIRDFFAEQCSKQGILQSIEYDKKANGYRLITKEVAHLSQGEMLAVCKILLESRAFTKEQVGSLLDGILNLCVPTKDKDEVEWFIINELFNYAAPAHSAISFDCLWMMAKSIKEQTVIEVDYLRLKDKEVVTRRIAPVGVLFSEYYFYLMGFIEDRETRIDFEKKDDPYPTIYRLDRVKGVRLTDERFFVPYKDKFKEGEYKNRVQLMYGGEVQHIEFKYYGPSVEAVLDKLPMAKASDEKDGVCTIKAEVFGKGILMWLLSQGSKVDVLAPKSLREAWLDEVQSIVRNNKG